mmetsp:Transcript_9961/g.32290  ORF Transcript_9961/g.32290 Transcript_9961/m.32290 type:complete len:416 (-) Transcript_9961:36-1283(-)|eukprot:CAMPEP_0182892758 /NCGR_PEP_ID=MMETSP0034_2-20130328/24061_1 /TAXON_ID=156128 /ORGANISM="Nephroselmis pyriformis, Strain CCMP717" /LENGTH=415 /DNA_ID=CAMNT_0025026459 /DNA_START=60 /DNA_END=1307 /DNA_ORIENTATION=-
MVATTARIAGVSAPRATLTSSKGMKGTFSGPAVALGATSTAALPARGRSAGLAVEAMSKVSCGHEAAQSLLAGLSDLPTATAKSQLVADVAVITPPPMTPTNIGVGVAAAAAIGLGIKTILDRPSRTYDDSSTVQESYNDWTDEGVLEHYWGEHIHLGYYNDEEIAKGAFKKDFKQAKFDFCDEMLAWSDATSPQKVLDVGCGIGGTTRHLGRKFPNADFTGITLSDSQVRRGTELAVEQNTPNVKFQVMDALNMSFPDNTFDLVWACESGEHMPDKKAYVEEMVRVLKPGGKIVIACWCQRETPPEFTAEEKDKLKFLYEEWAHPYFISYQEFGRMLEGTGVMEGIKGEDWVKNTIDSWRHSVWVGVVDPWFVVFKGPIIWYKTVREIVTLERMHRAFDSGLMAYGMIKGTKKA